MNWQNANHLIHCGHSAIALLAITIPRIAILLIVVALNLSGDALRDALDVQLKET